MTLFYPDISSYQAGISLGGLQAVCVKATEGGETAGGRYINPDYARAVQAAHANGATVYAYHYLHPAPAGEMTAEAQFALSVAGTGMALMIDAEAPGITIEHVQEFTSAYRGLGGNPQLLYLPRWFWADMGSPDLSGVGLHLVSSEYPPGGYTVNGPGWEAYGGVVPLIWQYSDHGTVNGRTPVDMNAFQGDAEELYQELYAVQIQRSHLPAYPGRMLQLTNPTMLGGDVRMWQAQMSLRGWVISVDGDYGPQSEQVCREFQQDSTAHGWTLAVDGVVGPLTWAASWERPVSS